MRKIAFVIISMLLYCSCAVSKRNAKTAEDDIGATVDNVYARIVDQNITGRSFFIERAEFKISGADGVKSGIGTVKFLMPDKFLISIKSVVGIEVARILLKGDSLFINDRFNKRLYYGSTSYLKDKYGITTSLLPVVLGDYVNDRRLDRDKVKCKDGKMDLTGVVNNTKIKYLIDCDIAKSILVIPEQTGDENSIQIRYSEFFRSDDIFTPGKIQIFERKTNTTIEVQIRKMSSPWNGTIDFIPGKQYDKIRLQ